MKMDKEAVDQVREQYQQAGYYIVAQPLVDAALLQAAVIGMEAVKNEEYDTAMPPSSHPGYDATKLCKINDVHLANKAIRALITAPVLGQWAATVTGAHRVQVWASQLLIKPPGSKAAGHVGWHQDRQYWQYWQKPDGLFTMWIALSEVRSNAGPMCFVRGSQQWGFLNQGDFFSSDQEALRQRIRMHAGKRWQEVPAILPAGGVTFHHSLTFHGSHANISKQPRCSIAVHMRTEAAQPVEGDTSYYVSHLDEPLYSPVIYQE